MKKRFVEIIVSSLGVNDENAIIYDFIINYENINPKFGIYHISAKGNICSWYEIAKFVSEYAKSKNIKFPKINKISSNQYKALALRPKNSCLNDTKFKIINEFNQINWKKHLANMLEEIFNISFNNLEIVVNLLKLLVLIFVL